MFCIHSLEYISISLISLSVFAFVILYFPLGAWEKPCPAEDPCILLQPGRVPVAVRVTEDLPGSVAELKEENTHLDQHEDARAGQANTHTFKHKGVNFYIAFRFNLSLILKSSRSIVNPLHKLSLKFLT